MATNKNIESSIVQIFSDHAIPSYSQPWSIIRREKSSGTGFCINLSGYLVDKYKSHANKDKYILTNAHCVHNATNIVIRKRGVAQLYKGRIDNMIYECDMAILSLDTEFYKKSKQKKDLDKRINEFWNGINPLEIGGLPSKLDNVYVYGYPLGGYNISITTGAVNRIQIIGYFEIVYGIAIQIDAPINFGNSGGPVVDINGKVVGIAFSGEDDRFTQNMGYIIPTMLVKYFLEITKEKRIFNGLSWLGINFQRLNNVVLRDYLKLESAITGVLITEVEKFSSSYGVLKEMDVLTHINNCKVDNDGTMSIKDIVFGGLIDAHKHNPREEYLNSELLQEGEVAPYDSFISLLKEGTIIDVNVLRNGKSHSIKIKLAPRSLLIPILDYQIQPSYYIIGGLVFIPLTTMFYLEKRQDREKIDLLFNIIEYGKKENIDDQVIILSQILHTELTEDYYGNNLVLQSINNIKINNLEHLYQITQKELKKSEYLKFKFQNIDSVIILSSADIIKRQENIIFDELGDIPEYQPS